MKQQRNRLAATRTALTGHVFGPFVSHDSLESFRLWRPMVVRSVLSGVATIKSQPRRQTMALYNLRRLHARKTTRRLAHGLAHCPRLFSLPIFFAGDRLFPPAAQLMSEGFLAFAFLDLPASGPAAIVPARHAIQFLPGHLIWSRTLRPIFPRRSLGPPKSLFAEWACFNRSPSTCWG